MNRALSRLNAAIVQSVSRFQESGTDSVLHSFTALQRVNNDLERRFNQLQKTLVAPKEKRLLALNKFKRGQRLTAAEWRLIFSSMSDDDEISIPVIEDDALFEQVRQEYLNRIQKQTLSRRDWLSLCYSYFAYDQVAAEDNANWIILRNDIAQGFESLCTRLGRTKAWMQVVIQNQELFTEKAGTQLADLLFSGQQQDLSSLQSIAQIPDSSWLWNRVFRAISSRIFMLDDDTFAKKIPSLLALSDLNKRYTNQVVAACLTRYSTTSYRDLSQPLLKQTALELWDSPQIKSKQHLWLQYVEKPVLDMVSAWFAKEDLEHFFRLLKGDADVDDSRLFYWLRFANQMSYTKIIMGTDAWYDKRSDFVEFKNKNKGRLSRLASGKSSDNAVIMQIGNFYFVEFSGTGHACYIYRVDNSPFNPEKSLLGTRDINNKDYVIDRLRHSPTAYPPNKVTGWMVNFDEALRRLGIAAYSGSKPEPVQPQRAANTQHSNAAQHDWDYDVASALGAFPYRVVNHLNKGGTYKVILKRMDNQARTALIRLGFRPMTQDPLTFWKK